MALPNPNTLAAIGAGDVPSPIPPAFHLCDAVYGERLDYRECASAVQALINGLPRVPFTTSFPWPNDNHLPIRETRGGCEVSLEIAGDSIPEVVMTSRQNVYNMGAWLITNCPFRRNGLGGFVTASMGRLMTYLVNPSTAITQPFPNTVWFTTLSLTSPGKELAPGDNDSAVPIAIADIIASVIKSDMSNLPSGPVLIERENFFREQAEYMERGGTSTWWEGQGNDIVEDEATYECEMSLGIPSEIDCTQIEWSQLNPASDTFTLGTDQVKFFHQNTCILAISAAKPITLPWKQIRTAISTLISVCVQDPYGPPRGGRAYYRAPSSTSGRVRRRDTTVTGWNALVPGLNVSVFNQNEPWVSDVVELTTCTWKAVMLGLDSTKCPR